MLFWQLRWSSRVAYALYSTLFSTAASLHVQGEDFEDDSSEGLFLIIPLEFIVASQMMHLLPV